MKFFFFKPKRKIQNLNFVLGNETPPWRRDSAAAKNLEVIETPPFAPGKRRRNQSNSPLSAAPPSVEVRRCGEAAELPPVKAAPDSTTPSEDGSSCAAVARTIGCWCAARRRRL